jgi:hypothetical protein
MRPADDLSLPCLLPHLSQIPASIAEFAERYRSSDVAREMSEELDAHLADQDALQAETENTQKYIDMEKHPLAFKGQPQRLDFFKQVKIAIVRECQQYVALRSLALRSRWTCQSVDLD